MTTESRFLMLTDEGYYHPDWLNSQPTERLRKEAVMEGLAWAGWKPRKWLLMSLKQIKPLAAQAYKMQVIVNLTVEIEDQAAFAYEVERLVRKFARQPTPSLN